MFRWQKVAPSKPSIKHFTSYESLFLFDSLSFFLGIPLHPPFCDIFLDLLDLLVHLSDLVPQIRQFCFDSVELKLNSYNEL